MSPAARKRLSLAVKRRWAEYREAKAAGTLPTSKGKWSPAKRAAQSKKLRAAWRRKRVGRVASVPMNDFMGTETGTLIAMRRRIDQELADRLVRGQTD